MTASAMHGVRKFLLSHPVAVPIPMVEGLSAADQKALGQMVELWRVKQPRNSLRQAYMDGRIRPDNLAIAVPDDMVEQLGVVIGWPRKAVFGLSDLLIWDGVTSADGNEDPYGLTEILDANNFDLEIGQTIPSALAMSCAFLTLRKGSPSVGEPDVIIQGHSADWATGLWDRVRRRLSYGLTIDDVDDLGRPTRMSLYTPNVTYVIVHDTPSWRVEAFDAHGIGQAMIEALPFEPSLDRPMGRSRISRDVMSITQRAMRTVLREELSMELFTAPGILLRGVDPETFDQLKSWSWKLGTVKGVSRDEEGEIPDVTVMPSQSAQPFTEQLRALATEFAGVTSLPVSSLGVVQDNPSSAEALYAAKEELVIKAKNATRTFDAALTRLYRHAVMLRDNLDHAPDDLRTITTRWGDPAHPSIVSQSDAIVKQISVFPWMADSPVVLEELGYSASQIARLMSDKRRAQGSAVLEALASTKEEPTALSDRPDGGADIRERFDALGIAIRAGVDPDSALTHLGLTGIKMTGAVPVSLRLPEKDASELEEA